MENTQAQLSKTNGFISAWQRWRERANGKPSLTVAVTKEQSGNTVAVSNAVRLVEPGNLPDDAAGDDCPSQAAYSHDHTVLAG